MGEALPYPGKSDAQAWLTQNAFFGALFGLYSLHLLLMLTNVAIAKFQWIIYLTFS